MEEINIFKNIITTENLMTELFSYFLNFTIFRDSFLKLLNPELINFIEYSDIETQYNTPNGIPDMAIVNDYLEILFEIKINDSPLTDNQPGGYIEYLKTLNQPYKDKWLVFIIPKTYKYISLINNKGFEDQSRTIVSDIKGLIIYWEDIIRMIEVNQLSFLNYSFRDFLGLLKMWYEIEEIKFDPGEIEYLFAKHILEEPNNKNAFTKQEVEAMTATNLMAHSFPKLIKFIDGIREVMSINFKSTINKYDISDEYGLYFKDKNGNDILFFGVWFPFWEKYNKPICFGVAKDYDTTIKNRFKDRYPNCIEYEGWYLYWIVKDSFHKNMMEETKREINDLLDYLLSKKTNEDK
jgi:hypothetical protein